ncbi:MAG: glycosyltransferase family 39 protein, partial [Chloroflexota bacterium]|nr:glycosyltransferase family 39 protein [Chloroflexota bacterium]
MIADVGQASERRLGDQPGGRQDARSVASAGRLLVVAGAVVAFLALALYQYRLPGLYYDEAADVVPAMQLWLDQPVSLQRGVGIHLFGRDFPVMIGDYWGTTSTYAVLPLFAIFGIGVLPIRLFPIIAGGIAIVLSWQLGRRIFDDPVGIVAAVLLAVSPTFVFWSRIGIYVIAHIVPITLGVMLAYLSWRDRPRAWKLLLAGFLAGLGLTTKLLFVWFFIAMPVAYVALLLYDWLGADRSRVAIGARDQRGRSFIAFAMEHIRRYLPARGFSDVMVIALAFGVGAFPVIYYNLASRGSYYLLRANLGSTERGVDNLAFLDNFRQQLSELRIFLDGGYFWFLGGVYTNPIATPVILSSVVGLVALTALPEHRRYRRPVLFLLAYAAAIFVLSCFSISILAATHLFIL